MQHGPSYFGMKDMLHVSPVESLIDDFASKPVQRVKKDSTRAVDILSKSPIFSAAFGTKPYKPALYFHQ